MAPSADLETMKARGQQCKGPTEPLVSQQNSGRCVALSENEEKSNTGVRSPMA